MPDLTIHHHIPFDPRDRVQAPCVWCGQPTPMRADPPFRPGLIVPLHLTCGVEMRDAYKVWSDPPPDLSYEESQRIGGLMVALARRLQMAIEP